MLFHQPGHQLCVGSGQMVLATKIERIRTAELGMISAPAFGDVVKERRQDQEIGTVESLHQGGAERELMIKTGQGKATQVTDDSQGMLIHGIGMVQVMLHLSHDASEGRQVASQHPQIIHAPQDIGGACRLSQDFEKLLLVDRVGTKSRIDVTFPPPDGTQDIGRKTAQVRVLLEQKEGIEEEFRFLVQKGTGGGAQQISLPYEGLLQENRRGVHGAGARFDLFHQDGVHQENGFGGFVVGLHQSFAGALLNRVLPAELKGERGLVIEEEAVFAALRKALQANAQVLQKPPEGTDLPRF